MRLRLLLAVLLLWFLEWSGLMGWYAQAQITRTAVMNDQLNIPVDANNVPYPITARSGAGSTCTDVTLNTAITAIGSTRAILPLVPRDGAQAACSWILSGNVTTNAGTYLLIEAPVVVNGGFTLTINGPWMSTIGPNWYSGAGTVTINYREPTVDALSSFIVSGCAPAVPAPASLTFAAFACRGNITHASQWFHVNQAAVALGPLSAGNGTYWLDLRRDTTTIPSGWTCQGGTYYCWILSASQPAEPVGGQIFARVTVAGGAITAVGDFRLPASYAKAGMYAPNDPLYGGVPDGTTDSAAALLLVMSGAASRGGWVDLGRATYAVASELVIPASGIFVRNGTIRATASISGDSAVVSAVARDNIQFEDVVFDANGNRRWGFSTDLATTNIRLTRIDALYYLDRFNSGFNIPATSYISLRPTPILQRTNYTSITSSATGGSIPAGTYGITVTATDAIGREGPFLLVNTTGISRTLVGATSTLSITWNANTNARSYRVYLGQTSVGWERLYTVAVDPTLPSTYSYTITGLWATVQPVIATATTGAGTFTGELYQDYFFRVAAEYSNGRNTYNGVVPSLITTINNTTTVITLTWTAPSGTTPDSYLVMVSRANTGGFNNFFEAIRINPAVTTLVYTGQVGRLMHPWGNVDQVPAEGYNQRPYGGSGIGLIAGSVQQANERPGFDADYQFARVENNPSTDPSTASFSGNAFSLAKVAGTLRLWWRNGVFGNSDDFWFSHREPTIANVVGIKRGIGLIRPGQAMASVYLAATSASVTGGGQLVTVGFDIREQDNLGNWDLVGNQFIVPTIPAAVAAVNARVSGVVTLTAPVSLPSTCFLRIRRGASIWQTNYNIPGSGAAGVHSLIVPDTVFTVVTGDAIFLQASCGSGGALTTGFLSDGNKETRLVVTLE